MWTVPFLRRRRLTAPGPLADRAWQALAVLGDPRRREVYDLVSGRDAPMTRDEVAEALGMSRSLVAFHLDKLADIGLLDVSFARPPGRPRGRGAGRPSKRYQLSDLDVGISVPPRRYDLVGRILARSLGAVAAGEAPAEAAWRVSSEEGRRLALGSPDDRGPAADGVAAQVQQVMEDCGYRPADDGRRIRPRNCPFLSVADAMPDLVCTMNHGFLAGVLDGLGATDAMTVERVEHRPGGCCVEIDRPPA
jgi:predicted ArsR family transcriptional regulator